MGITFLDEDESFRRFQRKRLAQLFDKPTSKKLKSHSPNFGNVDWDTQQVLSDLRTWPEGVAINWTRFVRSHTITGGNAGQVVKELAQRNGIDVEILDHHTPSRRLRSSKHKVAYGVSIPCNPTVTALKTNVVKLVQAGKLSVVNPAPRTLYDR